MLNYTQELGILNRLNAINIIKNDYVSEYLYETLLDGINDSYPLLEYIKYTYEPNKFADYINTLDILNPPV